MGITHGYLSGKALKLVKPMTKKADYEDKITNAFLELSPDKFDEVYQIVINT